MFMLCSICTSWGTCRRSLVSGCHPHLASLISDWTPSCTHWHSVCRFVRHEHVCIVANSFLLQCTCMHVHTHTHTHTHTYQCVRTETQTHTWHSCTHASGLLCCLCVLIWVWAGTGAGNVWQSDCARMVAEDARAPHPALENGVHQEIDRFDVHLTAFTLLAIPDWPSQARTSFFTGCRAFRLILRGSRSACGHFLWFTYAQLRPY
jgi:hypothetical protein